MKTGELSFGVYVLQDAPLPELRERWLEAEALGFEQIWVADHTQDFRTPSGVWFDAWVVLASMAEATTRVRIGTLVANPVLRPPAVLARAAASIDHLSGGRLELGLGTGIAGFDHDATGTPYWRIGERLDRFAEYVTIVDELLRRAPDPIAFDGGHLQARAAGIEPPTPQRPRPPLVLGGQSPRVLRLVAERADAWNTHGPFGASVPEILERTRQQARRLDDLSEQHGREPGSIRRSLLLYDALHAWRSRDAFESIVTSFAEIGFTEFVVFWPVDAERSLFERAVTDTIPALLGHVAASAPTEEVR